MGKRSEGIKAMNFLKKIGIGLSVLAAFMVITFLFVLLASALAGTFGIIIQIITGTAVVFLVAFLIGSFLDSLE